MKNIPKQYHPAIKKLIKKKLKEVVGEDEQEIPGEKIDKLIHNEDDWTLSYENDRIIDRNQLRAEQRKKAGL